ncbi:hypothetical protein [Streptomyces sp. H27-S2]|uniref:hypothetical protein n=1 Tax=Streptomyces antarcticus TaxID=2996458 RepID=UPI00226E02B8|nr:hypothetical protein [Streptomyces sp. H27-S2]MCY0954250.1 hypothetical protein [Streptomyces sp. H27-S2]
MVLRPPVQPMLAQAVETIPPPGVLRDPAYEQKFDGHRMLVFTPNRHETLPRRAHCGDEGGGNVAQGGVCSDEERFDSGQFVVHAGHRHFVVQVVNVADSTDDDVDSDSAAVVDQQAAGVGVSLTKPVQRFADAAAPEELFTGQWQNRTAWGSSRRSSP